MPDTPICSSANCGSAMGLTYLGLVMEEVGRALAPLPLHSTVVPALAILSFSP